MNGKPSDNPLTDFTLQGKHPFPLDIEDLLRRIEFLGRDSGRWPLGENWPFRPGSSTGKLGATSMALGVIWHTCSSCWQLGAQMKRC